MQKESAGPPQADAGRRDETPEEERANREAALDRTVEASFPASDPLSTNPNPDAPDLRVRRGRSG